MFEADLRKTARRGGLPGAATSAPADHRFMPGGHISALLSSVPGSGQVMEGGVVVYSHTAKRELLDVSAVHGSAIAVT